jgi:hypothetical protein
MWPFSPSSATPYHQSFRSHRREMWPGSPETAHWRRRSRWGRRQWSRGGDEDIDADLTWIQISNRPFFNWVRWVKVLFCALSWICHYVPLPSHICRLSIFFFSSEVVLLGCKIDGIYIGHYMFFFWVRCNLHAHSLTLTTWDVKMGLLGQYLCAPLVALTIFCTE